MMLFFFNDTATPEIYTYGHTLSLHDALPIYDLAEQRVAADVPRFDQQGATAIDAATDHAITGLLAQRQRFAAEQRFIDVRAAVEHDAVDRHLLAGPHAQAIANAHVFARDIVFLIAGKIGRASGRERGCQYV